MECFAVIAICVSHEMKDPSVLLPLKKNTPMDVPSQLGSENDSNGNFSLFSPPFLTLGFHSSYVFFFFLLLYIDAVSVFVSAACIRRHVLKIFPWAWAVKGATLKE